MKLLRKLAQWASASVLGSWVAIAFVAIGLVREGRVRALPLLDDIEQALLTWKFTARGLLRPSGDVVIAVVDERSLDRFGRWPWRRAVFARLVDRLVDYGAKTVVFDVVFDKPDRGGPQAGHGEDGDAAFARAIRAARRVILGSFLFDASDQLGERPEELFADLALVERAAAVNFKGALSAGALPEVVGIRAPTEVLARAAGKGIGYFNQEASRSRSVVVFASRLQNRVLFHLVVLAVSRFLGYDPVLVAGQQGPPRILVGDRLLPTEAQTVFHPNYYGPRNTFKHFSVADIVAGAVPRKRLEGKLVFVGATAVALPDNWPTPFDPAMPGVELHATAADNILSGRTLGRPWWLTLVELGFLLLAAPVLAFSLSRVRLGTGTLTVVLFATGTAIADYLLFRSGLLAHTALWYLELGTCVLLTYVLLYFRVYKERRKLRNTMQHYLAPSVLDEVLRESHQLRLGGEKRELTVLFSDIRGFTTLAESLDAPELASFLNEYFTPMTEIVLANLGTLDKYMGDALMAFFGAPQARLDHAAAACRAALEMHRKLQELNDLWRRQGRPNVEIGIGINTGPMAFGNMGSDQLFSYTVIGDHVNLGSRIEGVTKLFGVPILCSESTARAARGELLFRRLGAVRVSGKSEPQWVYELLGEHEGSSDLADWLTSFDEGVTRFSDGDLPAAEQAFARVLRSRTDPVAEVYLERITREREGEGEWSPVWSASK